MGLFVVDGSTRGEPPPGARDDLRGTWEAVESESSGNKKAYEGSWEFKDGKLFRTFKGNTTEYRYSVDPTKNPKQINLVAVNPKLAAKALEGIYTVDGDQLKICYPLSKKGAVKMRPTSFVTNAGDGNIVYTFKRKI
jgi:uncharacterized protein (TIGR03067 family)